MHITPRGINNPFAVEHNNIFNACFKKQFGNCRACRTCAADNHFYYFKIFFDYLGRVDERRKRCDGRAVLIVVHHRDIKPLLETLLDCKTLRRFDVLEINAAKRRRDGAYSIYNPINICLLCLPRARWRGQAPAGTHRHPQTF